MPSYPAIPDPSGGPESLRQAADAMKQIIESVLGIRGDPALAMVTQLQLDDLRRRVPYGASLQPDDTPTIVLNLSDAANFSLALAGDRIIGDPINAPINQRGALRITQDVTGGHVVTWGPAWKWAAGTAPTITATANRTSIVEYVVLEADYVFGKATLDVR